jgi:RHS repeat-associated protein
MFRYRRFICLLHVFICLIGAGSIVAQEAKNTENTADKNLKSAARINPSTLAMEFSVPFGNYPGRNGNSVPVQIDYSSKLWRMEMFSTVTANSSTTNYLNAVFADKTAAGWTSSLQPPRLKSTFEIYDESGYKYTPHFQTMLQQPYESPHPDPNYPYMLITRCFQSSRTLGNGQTVWVNEYCDTDELLKHAIVGQYQPNENDGRRFLVKRFQIQMPNGAAVEFRKDDNIYELCDQQNPAPPGCLDNVNQSIEGAYLSVDGSRMRLEIRETQPDGGKKDVLYLPDGGRYLFAQTSGIGQAAERFIDVDGNQILYIAGTTGQSAKTTDTMGREIQDFLPPNWFTQAQQVGTQTVNLKGLNNQPSIYEIRWDQLKTSECADIATAGCGANVLENDAQALRYKGETACINDNTGMLSPTLFNGNGYEKRICGRHHGADAGRFNPVVISSITLPDGAKYKFKYNVSGEITRIDYPTGGYERFRYDKIPTIGYEADEIYDQTNRGVVERWISFDGMTEQQHWVYQATGSSATVSAPYIVTSTAPDGSHTERYLNYSSSSEFGFTNILSGMPYDEKTYDKNGLLRSRILTDWTVKSTPATSTAATRDPRVKRNVSINIEGNQALAVFSTSDYDDNGSSDPTYFSHLNAKESKSYHYVEIPKATALSNDLSWTTLDSYLAAAVPSAVNQTDYLYGGQGTPGDVYKQRGIIGLPTETRSLNPANPADILAKSQLKYDEAAYPTLDADVSTVGWVNPATLRECVNNTADCKRGKATTSRTWVKETDTWLETHAQYDNFGNLRKAWDISGDPNKFVETQYSATYNYAYPTKVIAPAPNAGTVSDYGTTETSTSETTYDPTTGQPLSVTNDAGQITKTEYDAYSRPWRTYADNYTAPETQIIYGAPDPVTGQLAAGQRFVKTRTQIDAANWAEATTWMDGLGRTLKTQSKDSQGDVFTETQYDKMGRAVMTTNPYRAGETKLWNLTEFDALGRAVRSRAPMANQDPAAPVGDILGTSAFDFSTVAGYMGTVNISTDASGRKSRSITNALGQLLRIDEPTATGGTVDGDLGTLAAPTQPTFYKYDVYGRMVQVTQGNPAQAGQPLQNRYFLYDSFGRLLRVRQPEQEINAALNTTGNPDNNSWTAGFTYDLFGNVRTATDARGVTITNAYDRANRLLTKTYSGEIGQQTPTVYFTYDGKYYGAQGQPFTATGRAKGSLTQVRNGISTSQTTKYDTLGRAVEYAQITNGTTYTSKYAYNFAGALVQETYPDGRVVKNEFNQDGGLSRVFGKANATATEKTYVNSFAYTAAGGISQMRLGNGRWETAKFNNRLQMTELGLGNSATDASLWKVAFDYGELNADGGSVNQTKNTGNIARQTISFAGLAQPFVQSYRYDSLYRLTAASETNVNATTANWTQNFAYDRFGNRISLAQNLSGIPTTNTPTIDPATNRFTDLQTFGYDKNGNIITDKFGSQNRNFTFNGENKQTEIRDTTIGVSSSNPDANLIGRYSYDGEGKRVKKHTADETTIFVYSGGKLIQEYSTKLAVQPATNYTTSDHLGTPRIITDELGAIKARRDFMPFGEELLAGVGGRTSDAGQKYSATKDEVRQKFTGYQKDAETQLDFAEARMYNNSHGRFTAVDPLLASGNSSNPQTFNRYVYVGNNPVVITDPTGLFGDYYTRSGTYIGSDTDPKKKGDGKVYFGDIGSKEGDVTYVTNAVETYAAAVQNARNRTQNWYRQSPANPVGSFLDGFPTNPYGQAAEGFVTGVKNIPPTLWNGGLDAVTFGPLGLAGLNLDSLKAETSGCSSRIGCSWSVGTTMAGITAPGLVSGVFSGGSTLSIASGSNRFASPAVRALSPSRCFVAGTLIHTENGLVPIEKIKAGDKVLSYNEDGRQVEYQTVVRTFVNHSSNLFEVRVEGQSEPLVVTNGHPFYVHRARSNLSANEGEWINSDKLKAEDLVLKPDGIWVEIVSVNHVLGEAAVYNFEVEQNHDYFVGQNDWLVQLKPFKLIYCIKNFSWEI